jgi:hypothetical protein
MPGTHPWRPVAWLAAGILFLFAAAFAQQLPAPGIPAPSGIADYTAHAQTGQLIVAASLVPKKQVKRAFVLDISGSYIVFEVTCFPLGPEPGQVAPGDFLIHAAKNGQVDHAVDAERIFDELARRYGPHPAGTGPPRYTNARVEEGSRTNSAELRPRLTGSPDEEVWSPAMMNISQSLPLLKSQLASKSFPGGEFNHPISGYLYFRRADLKKVRGAYELEFRADSLKTTSVPITLKIPVDQH